MRYTFCYVYLVTMFGLMKKDVDYMSTFNNGLTGIDVTSPLL